MTTSESSEAERHRLILAHRPLARKLAEPYRRAYPQGDWHAVAYLGLVEAAARFDPEFGVPFGYFARGRVSGALQTAWRTEQRYRYARLDPQTFRAAFWPVDHAESADAVARLLRPLPPPIRATVKAVVLDDCTRVEAAKRLGCSPTLVTRRLHRGLKQVRQLLESNA